MHQHKDSALQQLLDLPATFKRPDPVFAQLMQAFASALALMNSARDGLMKQTRFQDATGGWVDVWGDLPGILRRTGESDAIYMSRLQNMILAWRGSPVAIEVWLQVVEHLTGIVFENLPQVGYRVFVPATVTAAQLKQVIADLAHVRPAGVPFNIAIRSGGTYLDTVNYCGPDNRSEVSGDSGLGFLVAEPGDMPLIALTRQPWQGARVTGAFLAPATQIEEVGLPVSTNNQESALPDLLLTDPTLNPRL